MNLRVLSLLLPLLAAAGSLPRSSDELRFCLHGAPKTMDPLLASDSPSETIRHLTAGTLVRLDRVTQRMTPELVSGWRVKPGNREIEFTLRPGLRFSDGSPLTPDDVIFTFRKILDPALHSPVGDYFRFPSGQLEVRRKGPLSVVITFPQPVARIVEIFDGVPVLSGRSASAVAGPYMVAENKAGSEILLRRNPQYWKMDDHGVRLPNMGAIRIKIQPNREMEMLDFERGDIDFIPELSPDLAERVAGQNKPALVDLGLTLDSLVMWVNQVPGASLPSFKKQWFQSAQFRKALSLAINRDDICRIAYLGKARPGVGPVSPANRDYFNAALKPDPHSPEQALSLLGGAGFTFKNGILLDAQGNKVEFSLITNSGNKTHERILGLMQQDLKKIGVKLTVLTLDFPSVIERITKTFNYEACLLALTNVGMDPAEQINVWLSSSANHQWNPNQKSPATPWEQEIDDEMRRLVSAVKPEDRKRAFDHVQALVVKNVPFIYIAHPRAQAAVSPGLKLSGAPIWPYLLWGLEQASIRR